LGNRNEVACRAVQAKTALVCRKILIWQLINWKQKLPTMQPKKLIFNSAKEYLREAAC
jgi:hypothetical protein